MAKLVHNGLTEEDVRTLKEHFQRPRQWNDNSICLNEKMKAVRTNRENKPLILAI